MLDANWEKRHRRWLGVRIYGMEDYRSGDLRVPKSRCRFASSHQGFGRVCSQILKPHWGFSRLIRSEEYRFSDLPRLDVTNRNSDGSHARAEEQF